MTPQLLSVCLAVALGLTTLAYRAAWKRSQSTRNSALREAARERAARVGAYRQLGVWMDRAQRAETVVAGYVMEAAEERARDERIWQNVKAAINRSGKPSRIAVEMPDVATDSGAATELLHLLVGPLEVEGE
jgi:hypothetical protein